MKKKTKAAIGEFFSTMLTEAEAEAILNNLEDAKAKIQPFLTELTTELSASPAPIHADIDVRWEVEGRRYRVLGFLNKGEPSTLGNTAFERVTAKLEPGERVVKTNEDWDQAYEDRHSIPSECEPYWLATKRPDPGAPEGVSLLGRGPGEWGEYWAHPGGLWSGRCLVLCRA